MRSEQRFVLVFSLVAGVSFAAYTFPYGELGLSERWFEGYLAAYARVVGHVVALLDPTVVVEGTLIAGRSSLRIVKTCDAMEANVLYAAAVVAVAGLWPRKLVALAAGLLGLVCLNVLRIASLYCARLFTPRWFDVLHEQVWPLLLIACAAGAFLRSVGFVRPGDHAPAGAGGGA